MTTDSRNVEKGAIFFALKGDHFDGNRFADEALDKGAALAVVDDKAIGGQSSVLYVDDALSTLQKLAAYHRDQLTIPLIGLTGSNGKTTTKELIQRVLNKKFRTVATTGNLNNHIGVPLTILGITPGTEMAVIEMGANHQGEIALLCNIAKPTHGLITNIGKAHLEGFGGFEGVVRAKTELYAYLKSVKGKAFVNRDDEMLMGLAARLPVMTYGMAEGADVQGRISGSSPFLEIEWGGFQLRTQLYGDYNFYNVMAAICAGTAFGVGKEDIADAVVHYVPSNSRSQVIESSRNTIMLDAYNANPTSMLAAIGHFGRQAFPRKMMILGDMLELGASSPGEHAAILRELDKYHASVILIGPEFTAADHEKKFITFPDAENAAAWLETHPPQGEHILIKGSRGMQLEKLLKKL